MFVGSGEFFGVDDIGASEVLDEVLVVGDGKLFDVTKDEDETSEVNGPDADDNCKGSDN